MKHLLAAMLVGLSVSVPAVAYGASPSLSLSTQGIDISVEFYSPTIARVYKTPAGHGYDKESLVAVMKKGDTNVSVSDKDGKKVIASDSITISVDPANGGITFYDHRGRQLLCDNPDGTTFTPITDGGAPSYKVKDAFALDAEEPIFGVGQVMDGKFNRRNSQYWMQNENMFTYSPYFMSPTKGYAVYWDNYSISEFVDTPEALTFESFGHCADYYFMYGSTPDGIISQVRALTGKAPMLPLWAYGFFQSRERYNTQDELLGTLQRYRDIGVPIDCVIQDWRYWPEYNHTDSAWNSQSFDPARYPDPKKCVDDIHRLNGKLLIVTWPGFGAKTDQYKELDSKGLMLNFYTFPDNSGARPYDVFSPEARDIYWKYLNKGIFSYIGNDGWWLDSTEPDHIDRKDSDYEQPTHLGTYRSVKNAFSLMHNIGIAEHQKAQNKDKRVVILTRSGFIGQQRLGSNTWSGDVESTWESLTNHIPAALNFTLMGLPNWNSDIGGFWGGRWADKGGCKSPEFQELYLRWMQFGTFCPMMRSHGTGLPREIWQFGEEGDWCYDGQEKMIRLRYRLLPYIYSTSYDVSANDGTFMRPLLMDFTDDKEVYNIGNEYMFGRSLLVAPVTAPGVDKWKVYLPAGADWWDFWTNERKSGGQYIDRPVTKEIIPVYVKAGSILPFGPDVQYSTEKPWDNLEIRVYPGADGSFTLYEDENDNYNYENGAFSTIDFKWDDKARKLTISDRRGTFPGMLEKRRFNIVLVGPASPSGDTPMPPAATVTYTGKQQTLRL